MTELWKKVQAEIDRRKLTPHPYAYFLAKRSVFWVLAGLSVLLGSVSIAVLIYAVTDYATSGGRGFDALPYEDFLGILPFIWLLTGALFVASAVYSFRNTRHGYRYRPIHVAAMVVLGSLAIGGLMHVFSVGWRTHELLEANLPAYKAWTANKEVNWGTPDQGFLAGAVTGFDGKFVLMVVDFDGKTWIVDTLGAEVTLDEPLGSEEDIAIRGTRTGDATFRAAKIRDWNP